MLREKRPQPFGIIRAKNLSDLIVYGHVYNKVRDEEILKNDSRKQQMHGLSFTRLRPKSQVNHYVRSADIKVVQGSTNKQPAPPRVQVTLDGQPVELSAKQGRSLQAIRSHLEAAALKRHRVLFSLAVNGVPVSLGESMSPFKTFHKVVARTIGFGQLSFQLVEVAADQVNLLHDRVERLALQVMINEWAKAEEMWWDLLPDLKDPLMTLSFVPPGIEFLPNGDEISAKSIKRFTQDLVVIMEEIERILARQELIELSNALENQLMPWLRALGHCLYRFHGPEPA
jgi:hypothetical protein